MDLTDASASTSSNPSNEEIDRLFEEALTSMDLPPAKVRELRNCDREKKLKIALDMRKTTDFKAPAEYLNELAVAIDAKKSIKKKKKLMKQQQTSTSILKHIEISLRTNPIQWVNSFLQAPNNGLTALIEYLAALEEEQFGNFDASDYDSANFGESKSSSDDSSTLKYSKSQTKMTMGTGGADDIQVLVLCYRAIMNNSLGINRVFSEDNAIYALTKCILHPNPRTKSCVYELLSAVCLFAGGHEKIIDSFDKFRVDFKESHRFQTLMRMMNDPVNLNNIDFLTAIMQFVNVLVNSGEDMNYRLYLQQEFTILGLDEFLKAHEDEQSEQLLVQVEAYFKNRIDLNDILSRSERLEQVEDKLNEVIKQLSSQREKYQNDLGEISEKNTELGNKLANLIAERQELLKTTEEKERSLRTLERQQFETEKKLRNVEGQLSVEVQRTKKAIENELSKPTTPKIEKMPKLSTTSSPGQLDKLAVKAEEIHVDSSAKQPAKVSANAPPAPPPPSMSLKSGPPLAPPLPKMGGPPPPPNLKGIPPPPPFLNPLKQAENVPTKKVIKTNVRLPAFNWTAMPPRNVKETIFHNLDDEKLVDVLNLDFIESMFGEEANGDKTTLTGPPSPTSTATSSNHSVTILDPKKLQNTAIMRRKLGKSIVEVMSAIHKLNLTYLNPDEVDILSRMLPLTKEETDGFTQYIQENGGIDGLSSDEQFVWKLQNIERVETKLKLMTFMSEFDGMIRRIEPELCKLALASQAVMESKKFQKVLEVLLAIGNAMNAGKNRPLVYGFKLSTLSRLTMQKSHKDPNITILHGLVDAIEHSNVECADFTKELNFVDDASTVMLSDVEILFRGLTSSFKIAEDELGRENPPVVLATFVGESKPHVERIAVKLENARAEFKKCVQLFGEDPKSQTPKDFFSLIYDFMQNFEMAHDQLQKRIADKEPKAPRPILPKRTAQSNADSQLFKELNSKFGTVKNREHKPSSKLPSNQMADGDLERMMSGLKDGYVASAGKCVRKPRSHVGDLQELSAGYREVCRERQA